MGNCNARQNAIEDLDEEDLAFYEAIGAVTIEPISSYLLRSLLNNLRNAASWPKRALADAKLTKRTTKMKCLRNYLVKEVVFPRNVERRLVKSRGTVVHAHQSCCGTVMQIYR